MAEFLIKAMDATHSDPIKDSRGCYKRGDIVEVRPNGAKYGISEVTPRFAVIKIPDLDFAAAKAKFETVQYQGDVLGEDPDKEITTRRRKFRIRVEDLPLTIKQEIQANGEVTVTLAQARNFIRNKATGLDEA